MVSSGGCVGFVSGEVVLLLKVGGTEYVGITGMVVERGCDYGRW